MPKIKKSDKKDEKHVEDPERSRREELENQLHRALADYQNLERRVEEERRLLGQLSSALLIEKFLPVLDHLESAQKHLNDEGLEIVIKQFKDILSSEGVSQVESEGSQFDPNLHEAVEMVEGEEDGRVVKVLRKGYKIGGKVLRPAQVSVSQKLAPSQAEEIQGGLNNE